MGNVDYKFFLSGSERCPVRTFVKYIRHLNPENPWLFQRPRKDVGTDNQKIWYTASPVGKDTLGGTLARLSGLLQLSQPYTNHSLRATTVHILDENDFPKRHIMAVTGHKAETSLRTYTGIDSTNCFFLFSENVNHIISVQLYFAVLLISELCQYVILITLYLYQSYRKHSYYFSLSFVYGCSCLYCG